MYASCVMESILQSRDVSSKRSGVKREEKTRREAALCWMGSMTHDMARTNGRIKKQHRLLTSFTAVISCPG